MWGEQLVIPEPHNNHALQCQLWMWEVPEAGLHLFFSPTHNKKVCLGLTSRKAAGVPDSKPSSGRGNSGHGGSSKVTPKKDGNVATTNSQGSSAPSASQPSPHCSGWGTSHHHKFHKKDSGEKQKKANDVSPAWRSAGHKACKDEGHR